ncbi:MAG TPA: hypothetical protein VH253_11740 [Phycisphaerae bacterium]|nr:hypothetical protein [Phycisphaerae bacterium]
MAATERVESIVDKVKQRLAGAQQHGIYLKVTAAKLDDDWLYITVAPTQAGISAAEAAAFMSKVERELRGGGDDKVLLVPALED